MKKTIYSVIFTGMLAIGLSSCAGHEDYDAYVDSLKAQPAVIDTISSPASYAVYLDSLAYRAEAFEQLGVKLEPAQKEELSSLSMQIQEALVAKFSQLSNQSVAVDTVIGVAAPVEQLSKPNDAVTND